MNYNDNITGLNNYPWYSDIPNPPQSIEFSSHQVHSRQESQHSDEQLMQREKKQSRGNRKLQRYRRKLRKQGMHSDAIVFSSSSAATTTTTTTTMSSIDNESKTSTEIEDENMETTTSSIMSEAIVHRSATNQNTKINRQRNKNIKMKVSLNEPISINEVNSLVSAELLKNIHNSMDYANISDEVFCQMLSTAFSGTNKLDDYFLNEKEKIDFVRHYTELINRLSYVKLLQQEWDSYYHIGITQNIWTHRISEHVAQKNSICYTYGRSKKIIQQRRIQIEKQLQLIQNTIQLFEKEILLKVEQHTDCSSEIKVLLSMINAFVHEYQHKSRLESECKRQILILDATDHRLVQTFFNLKPTKSQIICARHIWQATAKQILLEEQITIMEHLRTSVSSSSSTINLSDRMLDDIDQKLTKSLDNIDQNPSDSSLYIEFEKIKQFKQDILNQNVQSGRAMIETFMTTIHDEQKKFFFKRNADENRSNMEVAMVNAIETRRSHMIERGQYVTKQKLITSFKPINYTKDNIQ